MLGISSQTLQKISEKVGVTTGEAVAIEGAKRSQCTSNIWHIVTKATDLITVW